VAFGPLGLRWCSLVGRRHVLGQDRLRSYFTARIVPRVVDLPPMD
jgi:hypothetical protein